MTYIRPGVGACTAAEYYNNLIVSSNIYVAARATNSTPWNLAAMVTHKDSLATKENRYKILSYAVEHYNGALNEATSEKNDYMLSNGASADECIAVGVPTWKAYIDQAVKDGGWASYCIHDIITKDMLAPQGSTAHYTYEEQIDELFAYAQSLSDEGKLWIANFTEAALYHNEWSTSDVIAVVNGEENVKVAVTVKEDDSTHNVPLTIKVSVPRSWTTTSVNGNSLTVYSDTEGNNYVYVDVVPDTGAVTITK